MSEPDLEEQRTVEPLPNDGIQEFKREPAILQYTKEVWLAMKKTSQPEALGDEGVVYDVWTGFLTKLFAKMGLSTPYYSHVTRLFRTMDCARQIQRGGGSAASKWVLLQEPTLDLYLGRVEAVPGKFRGPEKDASVQQQLRDLNKRLNDLERWKEWHMETSHGAGTHA